MYKKNAISLTIFYQSIKNGFRDISPYLSTGGLSLKWVNAKLTSHSSEGSWRSLRAWVRLKIAPHWSSWQVSVRDQTHMILLCIHVTGLRPSKNLSGFQCHQLQSAWPPTTRYVPVVESEGDPGHLPAWEHFTKQLLITYCSGSGVAFILYICIKAHIHMCNT